MAAVLAGMVTYYFNLRVRASNARHGMIQIVAAADELPAGIPLATNDLALVEWPSSLSLPGSFSKTEEVLGRPLTHSVGAKQPILQRDLGFLGKSPQACARLQFDPMKSWV